MHKLTLISFSNLLLFTSLAWGDKPLPFARAEITQVVNDVSILQGEALDAMPAEENTFFQAPDLMQTGRRSRAQLTAKDGTITRIGSNTLFSFVPESRTIHLKKGSLLFNSPEGKGGGTVVTSSATASVLGTTIAVSTTTNGGFKVMCMEGKAKVEFTNGKTLILKAGQLTFVLPDGRIQQQNIKKKRDSAKRSGSRSDPAAIEQSGTEFPAEAPASKPGTVLNFDLERQQTGSQLLNGFSVELPSMTKIREATNVQIKRKSKGRYVETNVVVVDQSDEDSLSVLQRSIVETLQKQQDEQVVRDLILEIIGGESRVETALSGGIRFPLENGNTLEGHLFNSSIVVTEGSDPFLANSVFSNGVYRGLLAKSIEFNTESIDLSSVDRAGSSVISLAASDRIIFAGENSVISGIQYADTLHIIARDFSESDIASLILNPEQNENEVAMLIESQTRMSISNDTIGNRAGDLVLYVHDGDFIAEDNTLLSTNLGASLTNSIPLIGGDIEISATGRVSVSNSEVDAGSHEIHIGRFEDFTVEQPNTVNITNNSEITGSRILIESMSKIDVTDSILTSSGGSIEMLAFDRVELTSTVIDAGSHEVHLGKFGSFFEFNEADEVNVAGNSDVSGSAVFIEAARNSTVANSRLTAASGNVEILANENVFLNGAVINASGGELHIGRRSSLFSFLDKAENVAITNSSNLSGASIFVEAGDGINISDSSLTSSSGNVEVLAGKTLTLSNASIDAGMREVQLGRMSDFSIENSNDVTIGNNSNIAGGAIFIEANNNIVISDAAFTSAGGNIEVLASNEINVSDVQLNAGVQEVKIGELGNFSLDQPQEVSFAVNDATDNLINASAFSISAVDTINFFNARFNNSISTISLSARTVNLSDLNFPNGSDVQLQSSVGMLNIGSVSQGHVNFISNVTYGGDPAENFVSDSVGGLATDSTNVKIDISKL